MMWIVAAVVIAGLALVAILSVLLVIGVLFRDQARSNSAEKPETWDGPDVMHPDRWPRLGTTANGLPILRAPSGENIVIYPDGKIEPAESGYFLRPRMRDRK